MKIIPSTLALLVALTLAGCSRIEVTSDHDPSANFAALHTYAWRQDPPPAASDPQLDARLIGKRVRAAVDRVLASKGFEMAAAGTKPDFLVGYFAVIRQKMSAQAIDRGYGYRGRPWTGGPPRGVNTYESDYEEGTLLIDIIDPSGAEPLWRGSGKGVVDPHVSAEQREQRINEAVERILEAFPPR